ncbi:MAG: Hsp33 family molecular chaperone HslO [Burkholderiales bacterium]
MLTTDSLTRFMFEHAAVRGEIVSLDETWREVLKHADYPPPLQTLLGELMAAAALLIATLKFDGSMIIQLQSEGAVKLLVVEATSALALRATAKWEGELGEGNFVELLGSGRLVITLDPASTDKQAYQGIVPLVGPNVAAALMHYMTQSEQIDTHIVLAADDECAAGILVQKLPDKVDADQDAWQRASQLTSTVKAEELLNLDARLILHRLFHEEDLRVFESEQLHFQCSCSRMRVADMLKMLGREEVESVLEEQGKIEVQCEFCNRQYRFDSIDIAQLWLTSIAAQEGETRH